MRQLYRSWLCIAVVVATAGCDKDKSTPEGSPDGAAATGSTADGKVDSPAQAADAPPGIDPRCPKFRDAVSTALGGAVTGLGYWEPLNPGAKMRCIYDTAGGLGGAIEIGPSQDLAAERKGSKQGGTRSDSPLGSHAYRLAFGGLNHVIGVKGTKRIAIMGGADFPPLEVLWQKVADSE